jgi:hypothetical protein
VTDLTNSSWLSFPLVLIDGSTIRTVGTAANYFAGLTKEKRENNHWKVAIRMLSNALKEPNYLKTATMSLQTALLMDGLLESPLVIGGN